jgi:DNA-binding response OmpR family regulator
MASVMESGATSGGGRGLRPLAPKTSARSARILLVDVDLAFCDAAGKALRAAGHDVSIADNHDAALQILDNPRPLDLMITEIVMPRGVNGFALARMARMRRLELKILYLTAVEVPTEEAIGKILRKPIAMECLLAEAGLALMETKTTRSA